MSERVIVSSKDGANYSIPAERVGKGKFEDYTTVGPDDGTNYFAAVDVPAEEVVETTQEDQADEEKRLAALADKPKRATRTKAK